MNDYNSIAIFVAARNGDLDSLSARLNKLNLQETLADKRTLLHLAASRGHAHIVHFLIRNDANIDAKDINEYTPLSLAIGGNYMEVAKIIIQNGADVNIRQRNGETPLHIASRLKNIQFVEILLKNGADVNISSKYGGTPLYIATVSENIQLVEILLKNGADINIVNRYGETPLHVATKVNNIQLVDILLKNGADVNILNNYEKTPLHIATEMENIQLVDILLKNSADVNIVNADGKTPLHVATKMKNIQLLDILLKNGADVNIVSKYRETPLHVATKVNNIQFVEILLQNGAKLNGQDNFRKTIRRAVENNHIELIKILFKHGAKVYQLDKAYEGRTDKESSMTALHIAVKYRNFEMVKLLMTNGFDRIDAINELGETPLDLSIQSNCLDVVKHLIENGAKIRRKPVLEEALRSGNLELWKYLLTCNSTIIAKTCPCDSELHSAVRASQVEIVEEIIKKEAIKVKSDLRSCGCAVYIAVENGNEEILKILLTAGFSIKNFLGINPLHVAATFEHTRLVELLLKFGANINSRTDEHMITPLDFAAAAAHANMVKFLLDVGANPMVNRISDLTSLHYTLHRLLDNANETCVTPLMFQNLLKITEMLLIAGVNKIDEDNYEKLIINAIKLTVSSDDEQNSSCFNSKEISTEGNINDKKNNAKGEFRPEIIRCLLNYLKENKVNGVLDNLLYFNSKIISKIANVIMEYYDYRNISLLSPNYWIAVHVIDQIEDIHYLLSLTCSAEINILKMYVARLELLPCDQEAEKKKVDFYNKCSVYLDWQNECQKQIINMQKTKIIDESNVTFYDILMKSIKQVSIKIRNERLLNSLELSIEKFPIYADFFKIRVSKGKQRNELIDMCVNGMFRLIEKNYKITFCPEDIEEILQYLSVIELRKLSMACSLFS